MFGCILDCVIDTVDEVVRDPIGFAAKAVLQPVVDGCDLLDGLTEGEFRYKAALRLGTDVVAGMAISEVIDAMTD